MGGSDKNKCNVFDLLFCDTHNSLNTCTLYFRCEFDALPKGDFLFCAMHFSGIAKGMNPRTMGFKPFIIFIIFLRFLMRF